MKKQKTSLYRKTFYIPVSIYLLKGMNGFIILKRGEKDSEETELSLRTQNRMDERPERPFVL